MISNFEQFRGVFRDNINRRSRTAKGVSDVSSTSGKKKLLLEGDDLSDQVERNTRELIRVIWDDIQKLGEPILLGPAALRDRMENWYDIVNYNLQSSDVYAEVRAGYIAEARRLKEATGRDYRINHRYRLSIPRYLIEEGFPIFPIVELEFQMDYFYQELANLLVAYQVMRTINKPQLLSFADMQIDGRIHPWNDGCGRVATAMVMWLSSDSQVLPIFGDRDEHYAAIKAYDESAHVRYYEECLKRGQAG